MVIITRTVFVPCSFSSSFSFSGQGANEEKKEGQDSITTETQSLFFPSSDEESNFLLSLSTPFFFSSPSDQVELPSSSLPPSSPWTSIPSTQSVDHPGILIDLLDEHERVEWEKRRHEMEKEQSEPVQNGSTSSSMQPPPPIGIDSSESHYPTTESIPSVTNLDPEVKLHPPRANLSNSGLKFASPFFNGNDSVIVVNFNRDLILKQIGDQKMDNRRDYFNISFGFVSQKRFGTLLFVPLYFDMADDKNVSDTDAESILDQNHFHLFLENDRIILRAKLQSDKSYISRNVRRDVELTTDTRSITDTLSDQQSNSPFSDPVIVSESIRLNAKRRKKRSAKKEFTFVTLNLSTRIRFVDKLLTDGQFTEEKITLFRADLSVQKFDRRTSNENMSSSGGEDDQQKISLEFEKSGQWSRMVQVLKSIYFGSSPLPVPPRKFFVTPPPKLPPAGHHSSSGGKDNDHTYQMYDHPHSDHHPRGDGSLLTPPPSDHPSLDMDTVGSPSFHGCFRDVTFNGINLYLLSSSSSTLLDRTPSNRGHSSSSDQKNGHFHPFFFSFPSSAASSFEEEQEKEKFSSLVNFTHTSITQCNLLLPAAPFG